MSDPRPPALAQRLANAVCPKPQREHWLGDLDEQWAATLLSDGATLARRRYWRQVLAAVWHWPVRSALTAIPRHIHGRLVYGLNRESPMSALLHDLRFAGRQLLRHPSYLAVAVLSLALTIAANGIVFGLVNGLILNPFNYPDSPRLVSIGSAFPTLGRQLNFVEQHATADIEAFASIPTLEKLGAFDLGNRVLSYGEASDRLFTALVLLDPQPALGVPMTLGRSFRADELTPGGPRVAVLSHRIWVRMFGSDPDILGQVTRVNNDPTTIIGVLGPSVPLLGTDLWIPWGGNPALMPRNNRPFTVLARLKPGAALADVDAALQTIRARAKTTASTEYPEYADWRPSAATWAQAVTGDFFQAGAILLAAGALLLIVACVNLAGLLLARLGARQRELAVRRALGASTWRLTRLLVMESLLVSGISVAAGVALTRVGLIGLPSFLPDQITMVGFDLTMSASVVAYCALAGVFAALLTVLLPAWQMRGSVATSLADANRSTAGPARQRFRRALIVTEVALAVTLLVCASLFTRSYDRIGRIDPGFDPAGVLTMRLTVDPRVYPDEQAAAFFTELTGRLARLPGVTGAAAANQMPTGGGFDINFSVVGQPDPGATRPNALLTVASPSLFDVLRASMQTGRTLSDRDRAGSPASVVVNQSFARRYLNNAPSGRLRIGDADTEVDIVGVVADIRNQSLTTNARPEIFATMAQAGRGNNQYFLLVRTDGDPLALLPSVKRTVADLDANAPVYFVQTMEEIIATDVFPQRLAMILVGTFAFGSLIVALVGVYGLIAHWVVERTREMGIRLALGGTTRQVVGMVVGQAARLLVVGASVGVVGGIAAGYAVASLLFATAPFDPVAVGGAISVVALAGVIAAALPARRAISVNPLEVLRSE